MVLKTVKIHNVSAAQAQTESRWVIMAALLTIICCSLFIGLQCKTPSKAELQTWQIDAFSAFNAQEMGVFTGLQTAALEIDDAHDMMSDSGWPEIAELEENYIPPFVHDEAWKKQGRISWSMEDLRSNDLHIAIYRGVPADQGVRGMFLLLLLHDHAKKQGNAAVGPTHAPFEIWFNSKIDKNMPRVVTDQALIASGWKEVLARSGGEEEKRLKGK